MREISHITDGVCIGGIRAHRIHSSLRATGLIRVLQLHDDDDEPWPDDFIVLHNTIADNAPISRQALSRGLMFVHRCVARRQPVLVQCGIGISRSSIFVMAYLLDKGMTPQAAFEKLRAAHPSANPMPRLWESLAHHYVLAPQDLAFLQPHDHPCHQTRRLNKRHVHAEVDALRALE